MVVIRRDNLAVTQFVNPFKSSNSYVIKIDGVEGVWLFDIGNSSEIFSAITDYRINGLFLTHCHFDHIFGIKHLLNQHPECVLYGSKRCLEWLGDDRRNLSFYYEDPLNFKPQNCIDLSDGNHVFLDKSLFVEAFETPGHAEDCLTYKLKNFLITGDSYIPNVPPVTKLKGGSKSEYANSLQRIKALINNETVLLPGHGPIYLEEIN